MAPEEVKCGDRWLESSELRCTLPKGHSSMHWAKCRIEYEKVEITGEGEIWWNGEKIEEASERR